MAQQNLIIGAADAKAGESHFSAFTKTQANFTELFASLATQLADSIPINSASDFPAAVAGVRELTGGLNKVYVINADEIDVGSDRFKVTGGNCVVIGASRFSSRIKSSTTGDLFTVSNAGFATEFLALDSPSSPDLVNYSAVSLTSFVMNNTIIIGCQGVATVSGAFTTSLRTCTFVNSSVKGITWTGTANIQINMTDCLGLGWTGKLIDLGTATFNLIDIASNNRFLSPAGTTILSGAAAGANIEAGGRGVVTGSIFNGTGAALSGISPQDSKWHFDANIFGDNVTQNTRSTAEGFISASTTAPTAAAGSDVFVAIAGANWTFDEANRWTVSAAGLMTYIGLDAMSFSINHHSSGKPVSGSAVRMRTQLNINGTLSAKTIGSSTDNNITGMGGGGLFSISNGQTVQLFAAITGSVDIEFENCNISIMVAD